MTSPSSHLCILLITSNTSDTRTFILYGAFEERRASTPQTCLTSLTPSQQLRGLKSMANIRKRFSACPKYGYNPELSASPTQLLSGINASLLPDSSPTPQLLLSETNLIVHANASAARILRVVQLVSASQQNSRQNTTAVGPGSGADAQQPDLPGMTRVVVRSSERRCQNSRRRCMSRSLTRTRLVQLFFHNPGGMSRTASHPGPGLQCTDWTAETGDCESSEA